MRLVERALEPQRFSAFTVSAFAVVALVLAVIGIYGTLSYSVASRTREIGVRLAIGAQRSQVFRSVIGRALLLTVAGVSLGQLAAWWLTRALEGQIDGVERLDLPTLAGVAGAAAVAATLAAWLPARSAMAVDLNKALRQE